MSNNLRKITSEDVEKFMEGTDPMERITFIDYKYENSYVTIYYRNEKDEKCSRRQDFFPFCWANLSACKKLCNGDRNELKKLMAEKNIGCKKLSNVAYDGTVRKEFEEGYMFMFFAKVPMSYSTFCSFFRMAKNPLYGKKDKNGNSTQSKADQRQYIVVTPVEQFMIATGKRYFKGYTDYDQILRLTLDLETTGLDTKKDKIVQLGVRLNRPCPKAPNGFERIFTVSGDTEEERNASELKVIDTLMRVIYTFKPDIVTAHNGENFDWNMIIDACTRLGTSIEEVSKPYFENGDFIKKETKESILKLGGEIEKFYQTIVPCVTVTDSLHAVRRAQALDSNMQRADLKYATKYAGIVKPNRVYTPGKLISKIHADNRQRYAFNNTDGDWYIYDPKSNIGVKDRNEFNTDSDYESYLKSLKSKDGDKPFKLKRRNVLQDGYELVTGRYIVERYLLDDIWECDKVEWKYNSTNFLICKMLPVPYKKCTTMGTAGQWKALMLAWSYQNNLAIPKLEDTGSFTGGLSRLLSCGFNPNVIKLDYNSLYPSIILTWGICDNNDLLNSMLSFLEYVLTTREKYKGLKKLAENEMNKLKPFILDGSATAAQIEIYNNHVADFMLADGKQMQMKVFGNSFFGSFGANNGAMFPWKSKMCAEMTTCIGRQCLRLMISHFSKLGYKPLVGDTDGFNFQLPDESTYRYTEENPYIGKGSNREVKLGKKYVGFEADLAEFNDMYFYQPFAANGIQKMGCGLDEIVSSTINFSRKNYADYFPENPYPKDVKLVGNSIKSKKMPEYIAKFLAVGVRLLLQNKGKEFIEEYYKYIEKIYNFQIPVRDIATKGKIKKSIKEYLDDVKQLTKAGRPKSRQAWYELAIAKNLKVDNGDTIYYINTGSKKSETDVKKITHYYQYENDNKVEITKLIDKELKLERKNNAATTKEEFIKKAYPNAFSEDEIILNCELVPQDIIDADDDVLCSEFEIDGNSMEYNCPKYINMFNSRIKPMLVCFDRSIRDSILVNNPNDRNYFTEEQCVLVSGQPNKASDQDTYEQLLTMEDKEIHFWINAAEYFGPQVIPPFIEACEMGTWDSIKNDYLERMEREKQLGIDKEREMLEVMISELKKTDISSFFEEGDLPTGFVKKFSIDPETFEVKSMSYPEYSFGNLGNLMLDQYEKLNKQIEMEDFVYDTVDRV